MPIEISPRSTSHSRLRADCTKCSLEALCLPSGMDIAELEELAQNVEDAGNSDAPAIVFEPGQVQKYVYAVRAGTFKSYTITNGGVENVLGFHLPGELFGLDALHSGIHQSFATASRRSELCRLTVAKMDTLSEKLPSLRRKLVSLMSSELQRSAQFSQNYCARQGVMSFLLDLSLRLERRGYDKNYFELSMSHKDIANFLRITPETVSRQFSKLQQQGIIEKRGRTVSILNRALLAPEH